METHIKVEGRLCQEDVGEKAGTRSEYGQSVKVHDTIESKGPQNI